MLVLVHTKVEHAVQAQGIVNYKDMVELGDSHIFCAVLF